MQLRDIVSRFEGARKSGNGFIARCPAHKDNQQSLSLAESDGRILMNCFAGCTAANIVSCVGLQWKDLFDSRIAKTPRAGLATFSPGRADKPAAATPAGEKRILNIYPYVDESGKMLYENVRYHPKDFRQRHFDGNGSPVWNLAGVKRVPYRLPQLLSCIRQGADVFLCEGEKDADAVRELGFTASNFKGWNADLNRYIYGANVIIVADHDVPGHKHAEAAARVIKEAAKSVKIIDLFAHLDLPPKHGADVSDYIRTCVEDEGMTREEIAERVAALAENTAEWRDAAESVDYFTLKDADDWLDEARSTPAPKMLFGEFWFEGELCILFADTNVGKSILAVQIGDAIANGRWFSLHPDSAISGTGRPNRESDDSHSRHINAESQKIVYFDFELTAKQFESRFAERSPESNHYINHYRFGPNFVRAEINPDVTDMDGCTDLEEFLNQALEKAVRRSGSKVLIIDNLTYLRDETENARNALPLMKYLKELKSKYELSILALAHTPKRDSSKALGRNDLQGSKMLINFCDSSFAIGESHHDPGVRYLKQIKARNTEIIYHGENVLLAVITKARNFLRFDFTGTGSELEHLKPKSDRDKEVLIQRAKQLSAEGRTTREIAAELDISQASASRYINHAG